MNMNRCIKRGCGIFTVEFYSLIATMSFFALLGMTANARAEILILGDPGQSGAFAIPPKLHVIDSAVPDIELREITLSSEFKGLLAVTERPSTGELYAIAPGPFPTSHPFFRLYKIDLSTGAGTLVGA